MMNKEPHVQSNDWILLATFTTTPEADISE